MLCRRRRRDRSRGSEAESLLTIKYAHVLTLRTTHIHNHRCCCAVSCGREEKKKHTIFSVSSLFCIHHHPHLLSDGKYYRKNSEHTIGVILRRKNTLDSSLWYLFAFFFFSLCRCCSCLLTSFSIYSRHSQFYTEKKRRNLMRKMPRKKIEKKLDFSNFRENFYRIVVVEIPHRFWYRHTLVDSYIVCELQLFLHCTFLGWSTTWTRRDFVSDARRRLHAMRYPPKHIFSATVDSNKKFPKAKRERVRENMAKATGTSAAASSCCSSDCARWVVINLALLLLALVSGGMRTTTKQQRRAEERKKEGKKTLWIQRGTIEEVKGKAMVFSMAKTEHTTYKYIQQNISSSSRAFISEGKNLLVVETISTVDCISHHPLFRHIIIAYKYNCVECIVYISIPRSLTLLAQRGMGWLCWCVGKIAV